MNNLKEENIRRAIWGGSTTCSLGKDHFKRSSSNFGR